MILPSVFLCGFFAPSRLCVRFWVEKFQRKIGTTNLTQSGTFAKANF
jgi:hypothetical protein